MSNSKFTVTFKRIIAVNSANFAYVEVPLDSNLVMLATGNVGKTSLVNAIRFFLLPDINVKNATKKFGFVASSKGGNGGGYYTSDQIFDYYFSSVHSRLILEVEHKLIGGGVRKHCQIISGGENYALQRYFVPAAYDEISHLFWKKDEGAGLRPDSLPGGNLLAELRKINNKAKKVSQLDQVTSELYTVDILSPERYEYVVYPLAEVNERSVESLRSLIKLLFNQDSDSMAQMLASAIEMTGDNKVLEVNVGEIIEEQRVIASRKHRLSNLKAEQPRFNELKEHYTSIVKEPEITKDMIELFALLHKYKYSRNEELKRLQAIVSPIKVEVSEGEEKRNELKVDYRAQLLSLERYESEIRDNKQNIDKITSIVGEYGNLVMDEVVNILEEDLQNDTTTLENIKDEYKRRRRLSELSEEIAKIDDVIERDKSRLSLTKYALSEQLTVDELNKLRSINPELADANVGRELSVGEKEVIARFLALFGVEGEKLTFFDSELKFIGVNKFDDLEVRIEKNLSEKAALVKEERRLKRVDTDNVLHITSSVSSLEVKIRQTTEDLKLLGNYNLYVQLLAENERNRIDIKNKSESLKQELDSVVNRLTIKVSEQNSIKSEIDSLFVGLKAVQALEISYQYLVADVEDVDNKIANTIVNEIDEFDGAQIRMKFENLSEQQKRSKEARLIVYSKLCELISRGFVADDYDLFSHQADDEAVSQTFESLQSEYELLEQNEALLKRDTQTHNDHVRNRLERLSKTRDKIYKTISDVNAELRKSQINNLEGVRMNLTLNNHFDDLVLTWRQFDDVNTASTLPEDWYFRLQTFLESDAIDASDGQLRMGGIIEFVGYETKKIGETWDTKEQSNSTKMMINVHLCEMFIQRLTNGSSEVQFPLVMDEVGSVSSEQFSPLITSVNEKGRYIIGATTHGKSADLISKFSNYVILDEMSSALPYDQSRTSVFYSREKEYLKEKVAQYQLTTSEV